MRKFGRESSTTLCTRAHVLTVQHNNFYMIYIQFAFKQPQPQLFLHLRANISKCKCSKRLRNKYSSAIIIPRMQQIS